jgi:signal transduction histidine kinase
MKILIADDEPVAAKILQNALHSFGHEVIVTSCGVEAWEAFDREPVRVVVSDWLMPGMDGLDLCKKIRGRKKTPYTYFILLSQKETKTENYTLASDAGVDDFLTKPLDRRAIRMRLQVAERILRFTSEIHQLKDRASKTARDISERKKSEQLLRAANVALLESEKHVLAVSEGERQRIGADLHDNVGQQLTAIELLCQSLREGPRDFPRIDSQMDQICRFLQEAVTQTRQLARGLMPLSPNGGGLAGGLKELVLRMSHGPVQCDFLCNSAVNIRDHNVANHLFHIAQEAVNNATKHAHARKVKVTLSHGRDTVTLQVEDDGQGFPKSKRAAFGLGLRIMRHRANVIGATLETLSIRGKGAKVTCTLKKRA